MSTTTTNMPTDTVGDRPANCTEDLGKGSADRTTTAGRTPRAQMSRR
jgi:hypothetical protein